MMAWQTTVRIGTSGAGIALLLLLMTGCGGDGEGRVPTAPAIGPGSSEPRSIGPIAFVSTRDGAASIYVANADGSGATRLRSGQGPVWSRDGRIVFHDRDQVMVMNADGSNSRSLGPGRDPAWSPDGRIVFSTPGGASGVFVMNADGSNRQLLIRNDFVQSGDGLLTPAWSPDGRSIAFVRANWDEPRQIYVMNADGSDPRRLINGSIPAQSSPDWSPDSSKLVFESPFGLATVNADGSDWSGSGWNFLKMTMAQVFEPAFTAEGGNVLFTAPSSGGATGGSLEGVPLRIFIAPADGGAGRQLIPDAIAPKVANYRDYQAAWRP